MALTSQEQGSQKVGGGHDQEPDKCAERPVVEAALSRQQLHLTSPPTKPPAPHRLAAFRHLVGRLGYNGERQTPYRSPWTQCR
jgi:hypothetical protein